MSSLPNLLCILRLALAPAVAGSLINGRAGRALLLAAVAGLTDFLDGWLARRYRWQSALGAYLDPAADKVLLLAAFVALGVDGALPWWLVGLVFARDLMIVAGAAALYALTREGRFPPSWPGKVSTAVQITLVLAATGRAAWPEVAPAPAVTVLVWLTAAAALWSGLGYLRAGRDRLKSQA